MKILINAVSAKSGGSATYVRNLADSLSSRDNGDEFIVLVPKGFCEGGSRGDARVKVVECEAGFKDSLRRFFWDQVTLRKICRDEKVEIVISCSDFSVLYPPCKHILLVRNGTFFSDFYRREILPRKQPRKRLAFELRRLLALWTIASSDVIMVASHAMLESVCRTIRVKNGRSVVNYFGVPLRKFAGNGLKVQGRIRGRQGTPFTLIFVSDYADYKNFAVIFKAIRSLRGKGITNFRCILTIDPARFSNDEVVTRRTDRALADDPNVAPALQYAKYMSYEDVSHLYGQADILIFPSFVESFGHPLVEAMASGLPILASDIPICREICRDAAWYFDPHRHDDLAEKILFLWERPEIRMQLSESGIGRAGSQFDWEDHVRRLFDISLLAAQTDSPLSG